MEQHERHRVIIRAVDSGSKTIAQLYEITGASAVTIRRDLSELDALGRWIGFVAGRGPCVDGVPAIRWKCVNMNNQLQKGR
ncbi:DeoR family transcriptional regulator [Corynebacterium pseudotuberculosis]|uniref:DeoR family transcriptional regulator n=1 Tax=Corynebacterium pseudotuberculosis TaxID=1719 RepID=UPI000B18FB6A|nr:DeoR family transcriptional regulator [Corynebacterium pseudotuberculosis]MEB3107208.1 DeoR family transcriptional regulator [Corynebacterium pseudotuberculosis]VTQ72284.1 glycerol-3-phosphate regulon repressor [Corynebacterium pseudotuberculosis]